MLKAPGEAPSTTNYQPAKVELRVSLSKCTHEEIDTCQHFSQIHISVSHSKNGEKYSFVVCGFETHSLVNEDSRNSEASKSVKT